MLACEWHVAKVLLLCSISLSIGGVNPFEYISPLLLGINVVDFENVLCKDYVNNPNLKHFLWCCANI